MDNQGSPQEKYYRFDADDETVQLIRQVEEAILSLIKKDSTKINEIQPNGYTLLQVAAYEGCTNVVKFLMDQGADIHLRAYSDETALHLACDKGHEDIVKILLKRRSQIEQRDDRWGNTALHFAARGGNENIVRLILAQNLLEINVENKCEKTALHIACEEGHANIVKLLVNWGAEIKSTTLRAAIIGQNKSIVELILDSGIGDVNEVSVFGEFFCLACNLNNKDIIKLLLERGPNVNVEELYFMNYHNLLRYTAKEKSVFEFLVDFALGAYIPVDLRMAVLKIVQQGSKLETLVTSGSKNLLDNSDEINEKIVKFLIDRGIDVISTRVFNESLSRACEQGYEDIVQKLFDRVPKSKIKDKLDKTILVDAAKGGNLNIFQLILNQVVDLNVKNNRNETALHMACKKGHEEIVKILINRGADLNAIGWFNNTTLHYAAKSGNINIFKLISDHGFDVNKRNERDETVLHIVCKEGHEEILKILLASDKFVNMKVKDWFKCSGDTVLHLAVREKNKNIVKLLLDGGIEVDLINDEQEIALHLACAVGSEEIVEILIDHGANVGNSSKVSDSSYLVKGSVLHSAVLGENKNLVKFWLDRGVDVHSRDSDGATPLLWAVKVGNIEIIELLIKYGAEITDKDNLGRSVYHELAENLRIMCQVYHENRNKTIVQNALKINKIVRLFLNFGLDINCTDDRGYTPLHTLVRVRNPKSRYILEIIKFFLNFGANIFAKNNFGQTAFELACNNGQVSTAKLLFHLGAETEAMGRMKITKILCSLVKILSWDINVIKLLLHNGAHVNHDDGLDIRPVLSLIPCESKELLLFELLLEHGANVNKPDTFGYPLSLAIKRGQSKSVELFLDYGADINIEDENFERIIRCSILTCTKPYESDNITSAAIITRHVVKLIATNEHVPDEFLRYIIRNEVLKDFKIKCESEIEKMKSNDSGVPLWRILISKDRPCLAKIARNEETLKFLSSEKCVSEYPIYSSVLKNQMRRGIWEKIIRDKVKYFFKALGEAEGNGLPILPHDCADEIFSYLSDMDFRNLFRVCDPHNDIDLCDIKI